MRDVRADIHQVSDAVATLAFSIPLEELTHLEEEHYEDSLRKLGFSTRQESDTEGSDGGYRHEKMLIEGISVEQTLNGLLQRVVPDEQIGDEINQQQLPLRQVGILLDENRCNQQYDGGDNKLELLLQRMLVMVFVLMLVLAALMMMFVLMCHNYKL